MIFFVYLRKQQRPSQVNQPPADAQAGNVMMLILVAVILFAALGYVIAQSTRAPAGGAGAEENTSLRASQITQYGVYLEQSIMRMTMASIPAEQLCFDHDGWGHDDYNHSGCLTEKNQIFSTLPDSGNVSWAQPPAGSNDGSPWYIPADVCVPGVGRSLVANCNTDGTGNSEDIVAILPNVDRAVCLALNTKLHIENPNGSPPRAGGVLYTSGHYFAGSFADGGSIDSAGSDAAILRGRTYGCVEGAGTPPVGTYHFYHVLLAR